MANVSEIGACFQRLVDAMPAPRGVDKERAAEGYVVALTKFTVEEINEGIDRFMRGECDPKISLKFYPRPPELARIIGGVHAEKVAEAERQRRAERAAQDRRELAESERLLIKSPEAKARAAAIMQRFHEGIARTKLENPHARSPGQRTPAAAVAESDAIREKYGMTPEKLAGLRDAKPLPNGVQQVADALPGLPAPEDTPLLPPPDDDDLRGLFS